MAILVFGTFVLPVIARAQESAGKEVPPTLDPMVVTAARLPQSLYDAPAAISVVEGGDVGNAQRGVGLDEVLDRVPGVQVQNSDNYAQDYRIQIRGFGARAGFGVREIKVLLDGIPETLPDGQTELDAIDLGAVEHIEVLRGPASSLYGNASGGVIQLFTRRPAEGREAEARATGGSFALQKYELRAGQRSGAWLAHAHSSFTELHGFRDHGASRSATLNARLGFEPDDCTEAALLFSGVEGLKAEDPGGLTRAEADADPSQARPLNARLDAGEEVEQGRLALTGRHRLRAGELSGYAYALYRDFQNRLPIPPGGPPEQGGIVTFHRVSPGGGLRYLYDEPLFGWAQQLSAGVDVQHQHDERRRYVNEDGERGQLGLHQNEQVTGVGPYVHEVVAVRSDLELNAGLRYDSVRFRVKPHAPATDTGADARRLDAWSPSGGARYSPLPWLTLWGNVGTAFQVPTTTELANPAGGGFNPDLDPQTAVGYELGARTRSAPFDAGLALFVVNVSDALVPFELESQPGRTFFRNAGRLRRYGAELEWVARPLVGLRWTSAMTFIHAEFRDFKTGAASFDGNTEPGIPPWQIYQEVLYERAGFTAAVESVLADRFFVDDANQWRSRATALLNLRLGYRRTLGPLEVAPFAGVQNLADLGYDARVRVNAQGTRFFEPGAGVNAYGGLSLRAAL